MNEMEKEIITRVSETFTDFNCTRKDLLGISLNFYPDDIEKIYEFIYTFVSMNLPEKYFSYDYSKRNKLFLIHISFGGKDFLEVCKYSLKFNKLNIELYLK